MVSVGSSERARPQPNPGQMIMIKGDTNAFKTNATIPASQYDHLHLFTSILLHLKLAYN
jgi:hypothetical protein